MDRRGNACGMGGGCEARIIRCMIRSNKVSSKQLIGFGVNLFLTLVVIN